MAYILIVDDDDIVAEHAAEVLMDAGHAAGWVSNAEEAFELLSKRRPDLVLLDQNMPGENGTSLLRRLRNSPQFYDLPIVMLTGVTGFEEEQIAYHCGAQDYIRKPFGSATLIFRVNQILKARERRHVALEERLGVTPGNAAATRKRLIC